MIQNYFILFYFILVAPGREERCFSGVKVHLPVEKDGGPRRVVLLGRRLGFTVCQHRLPGGSGKGSAAGSRCRFAGCLSAVFLLPKGGLNPAAEPLNEALAPKPDYLNWFK